MTTIFSFQTLSLICGYMLCGFIGLLGLMILRLIYIGEINLSRLISEPTGDASISRFQFLVFTFVISLSLFLIVVAANPAKFPEIPSTVLTLLGISGTSYLVSKGIQFSDPAGTTDHSVGVVLSPVTAVIHYGQTQQFKAEVPHKPGSTVTWKVMAGSGTIDTNGLYTAPAVPSAGATPGSEHATIQVTSSEFPENHDLAVITLA